MNLGDNGTEIEKLSEILTKIQNLYYKKKEQLEELENEISELREVLNFLNSMISNKSFQSADVIYSKTLQKTEKKKDEEKYFVNDIPSERVKGTNIKRKIFTDDDEKDSKLLCILNFLDLNNVKIKLINPLERGIRETSEDFIRTFLMEALLKIKDQNPDLDLKYEYFKNTDVIEGLNIINLKSIQEYDLITSKMRELLTKQITS
ncbi:MAG: hypothetical protein KGD65_15920 [Candidatus Lokiarchaeota archaeon]|nr:hypothetical protein [Candidatus Lokiarchaeota archaeon]